VSSRKDEAIAVDPGGILGVVLHLHNLCWIVCWITRRIANLDSFSLLKAI
jgi:hypothetical protein